MAERQIVISIELELLPPQVIKSSVNDFLFDQGVVAVSIVERRLPRVPRGKLQALGKVFIQCRLQSIVMSVKSILVVRQVLGPTELRIVLAQVVCVAGLPIHRGGWGVRIPAKISIAR